MILIILVAVGGLTFATTRLMNGSSTIVTFGDYNVDYVGKTEISVDGLEPISDSLIGYNTYDGVIRLEFSLRGVESNEEDKDLIYDIMLSELNIDCSLLNKYTKWNLYKNGKLLYNGNFSKEFDGNILKDNYRLTEIQQDLPKYNEDYDDYVLIIWISEACNDLMNCELVDQSLISNSIMNMKVFVGLSGGEKKEYERIADNSSICLNKPILSGGMIPVYNDEGKWMVADKTNSDLKKSWYDYSKQKWANVVYVNTDKYDDSKPGNVVMEEDVIGYYVWIPRFKYKLWNVEDKITDSYDAYNKGIDIIFESGVHTTGEAKCSEDRCGGYNNQYLTHPAFSNDLRGFWVSKYEISNGSKFIPNVVSLSDDTIDSYKNMINNLSNIYGEDISSHIITNMEWGAVTYLSHSKYGLCNNYKCNNIGINKSNVSFNDMKDTTTGNIYGVFDMAGASSEYVVGNVGLGSSTSEVLINDTLTWYNGSYLNISNDYILRGGVDKGLYSINDIKNNISTRSIVINK